ncbi:MAG: two-component regulator propeller domain-containing protein [Bacteroidota bacterium]
MLKTLTFTYRLLLLLIICFGGSAAAQDPVYWQLTDEDGLPSMTVYKIIQDHKGYIWMGTSNGLCRYDGKEIKVFNSPLLKGNEILQVRVNPSNTLFFNNLEGQLAYCKDGQIGIYKEGVFIDTTNVSEIDFVHDRMVIFKRKPVYGCTIYELDEKFTPIRRHEFSAPARFLFSHQDTMRLVSWFPNLWGSQSIHPINPSSYEIGPGKGYPIRQSYNKMVQSFNDQFIIFQTENTAYAYQGDNSSTLYESKDAINGLHIIDEDIWILTKKGMVRYSANSKDKSPKILSSIYCNVITKDREGNYWVGTTDNGVYIIPSMAFEVYTQNNTRLPDQRISDIYPVPDSDLIYVGHNSKVISVFNSSGEILKTITLPDQDARITDILTTPQREVYLSSDFGIYKLDSELKLINYWPKVGAKELLIDEEAKRLYVAGPTNTIWMPIALLDRPLPKDYPSLNKNNSLVKQRTYDLIKDHQGNIWFGTTQGIYTSRDSISPFLEEGRHQKYSVNCIALAADSTLWFGTQSDGLIGIKNDQVVARYRRQEGLASDKCQTLFIDEQQKLWVGGNKGVNYLDLESNSIALINTLDGLPTNEVTAIATKGDRVWVGTPRGLTSFPKSAIQQNKVAPPIRITQVKIWEQDTLLQESYQLPYNQNNLYIAFKGIALRARGQSSYRYRMLGVDTNWVETTTEFVRYPALNPNAYTFEVVAVNEDGVASEQAARLSFVIAPPWWQTLWFRLLAIIFSVTGMALIFYLRLINIRRKEKEQMAFKEKVNELRMQALQVQMNPHFVFNALNAIQKYLTTNEQEQAMIYLARFARLIRMIFEHSKKKLISLEEELDFLKLYLELEGLRFKNKIDVTIDVDDTLTEKAESIKIPPLLIQPVVENAFKHGLLHKKDNGRLLLHFTKESDQLLCTVEDNGVGREKARQFNEWRPREYESSGLKTTRERLAIINLEEMASQHTTAGMDITDLQDAAGKASGTRVTIRISCEL